MKAAATLRRAYKEAMLAGDREQVNRFRDLEHELVRVFPNSGEDQTT